MPAEKRPEIIDKESRESRLCAEATGMFQNIKPKRFRALAFPAASDYYSITKIREGKPTRAGAKLAVGQAVTVAAYDGSGSKL